MRHARCLDRGLGPLDPRRGRCLGPLWLPRHSPPERVILGNVRLSGCLWPNARFPRDDTPRGPHSTCRLTCCCPVPEEAGPSDPRPVSCQSDKPGDAPGPGCGDTPGVSRGQGDAGKPGQGAVKKATDSGTLVELSWYVCHAGGLRTPRALWGLSGRCLGLATRELIKACSAFNAIPSWGGAHGFGAGLDDGFPQRHHMFTLPWYASGAGAAGGADAIANLADSAESH